jgi:hypothetical protein
VRLGPESQQVSLALLKLLHSIFHSKTRLSKLPQLKFRLRAIIVSAL